MFNNNNRLEKKERYYQHSSSVRGFVLDLIKLAVIAFILVWPIHKFVFQPFYVSGSSMEPNFYDNQYLIINELSYRFHDLKRGDVVVFRSPMNPKSHLIKRLIGLPGERVVVESGKVYIYNQEFPNGFELNETAYLAPGVTTAGKIDIKLSEDEYYFLGDNRNVSLDSRVFGPIKRRDITGRTEIRGWPLTKIGLIKTPIY